MNTSICLLARFDMGDSLIGTPSAIFFYLGLCLAFLGYRKENRLLMGVGGFIAVYFPLIKIHLDKSGVLSVPIIITLLIIGLKNCFNEESDGKVESDGNSNKNPPQIPKERKSEPPESSIPPKLVICPKCGAGNRVMNYDPSRFRPKCGKCGSKWDPLSKKNLHEQQNPQKNNTETEVQTLVLTCRFCSHQNRIKGGYEGFTEKEWPRCESCGARL
jgi:transposase-like protein